MHSQEYELLVAALLLRDSLFARRWQAHALDALDDLFGHFALRNLIRWGLEHHKKHGELLPEEALAEEIGRRLNGSAGAEVHHEMLATVFSRDLSAREHVEQTLLRETRKRAVDMLDKPTTGELPELEEYIALLRKIKAHGDHRQNATLVHSIQPMQGAYDGLSTGFPSLDALLDGGGLCPGELGVIHGDPGEGKTRALINIARYTAMMNPGKLVYFISYEVVEHRLLQRLERQLGRPVADVFGPPPKPAIALRFTADPLFNPDMIAADIDELESLWDTKCVMVVRDYGELCVTETGDYKAVLESYRQFRNMLGETKRVGWDAMQSNRFGEASFFDIRKPVDVMLRLTSMGEYRQSLRVVKNREGPTGQTVYLTVDPERGILREDNREGKTVVEE